MDGWLMNATHARRGGGGGGGSSPPHLAGAFVCSLLCCRGFFSSLLVCLIWLLNFFGVWGLGVFGTFKFGGQMIWHDNSSNWHSSSLLFLSPRSSQQIGFVNYLLLIHEHQQVEATTTTRRTVSCFIYLGDQDITDSPSSSSSSSASSSFFVLRSDRIDRWHTISSGTCTTSTAFSPSRSLPTYLYLFSWRLDTFATKMLAATDDVCFT
jgi:hypothetical protein